MKKILLVLCCFISTLGAEVVQKEEMMVVGIACRTSNNSNAAPIDIPNLWVKFFTENTINSIPNIASNEVIALYCDYEGDHTKPYTLVIGCPVTSFNDIPDGMVAKIIPASTYEVFHAIGEHPRAVIQTWSKIWMSNLERTYTGDFEVYGKRADEVNVYIAIRD